MEFAWCEFAIGKQEGNSFVKTINRIKLFPQAEGGTIKFNWEEKGGRWLYDEDAGILFIEFKSPNKGTVPNRRHALRQRDDGNFQLLPWDNEIYRREGKWTEGTVPHKNWNTIIMQKILFPDVPE